MQGEYVEVRPRVSEHKYRMAQDILKYISQYCHINTTEDEVYFLSEILISAKGLIEQIGPVIYQTVPESADELMKKIRKVIRGYFNQSIESSFTSANTYSIRCRVYGLERCGYEVGTKIIRAWLY